MITEVHAITSFAHIKVKQTHINKRWYIRKHAFRLSFMIMFLVKRTIPTLKLSYSKKLVGSGFSISLVKSLSDYSKAIKVNCRLLNMALCASLRGATPNPQGCICTSPLKRAFQYVLFGQDKYVWV